MSTGSHLQKTHGVDTYAMTRHSPVKPDFDALHDEMHADGEWNEASTRHTHRNGFVQRAMKESRTPINPISDRQRARIVTLAEATEVLRDWTGDRCQGRIPVHCTGTGQHAHHVKRRSQGGSDDVTNLRWLCRACHSWAHHNVAEAKVLGLLHTNTVEPEPEEGDLYDYGNCPGYTAAGRAS